ncbi:hypothetical protein BJX99DRAFT_256111 [Aspergillus californicus]
MDIENIWQGVLTGDPISRNILDILLNGWTDLALVDVMVAAPGMAGYIWEYALISGRWLWSQDFDSGIHVTLWHKRRHEELQCNNRIADLRVAKEQALQDLDRALEDQIDVEIRQWRIKQLNTRRRILMTTLTTMQRNQTRHASIFPGVLSPAPVPGSEGRWYIDSWPRIQAIFMARATLLQREIQTLQARVPANAQPLANPVIDLPFPCTWANAEPNVEGIFQPIEELIRQNARITLMMLQRIGLFNPAGWTLSGHTYFSLAVKHDAQQVLSAINPRTLVDWRRPIIYTSIHAQEPAYNHLDALVQVPTLHNLFLRVWQNFVSQVGNGSTALPTVNDCLHNYSQQLLCTRVTLAWATELQNATGHILGRITNQPGNPFTPWNSGGTPWHTAARNPSVTFISQVYNNQPHTMNNLNAAGCSALRVAITAGNCYANAARIIQLGCSAELDGVILLQELCDPEDRGWRLILDNTNRFFLRPHVNIQQRTYLHAVVDGCSTRIGAVNRDPNLTRREKEKLRRRHFKRAEKLISMIRYKGPLEVDMNTRFRNETAERYAQTTAAGLVRPLAVFLGTGGNASGTRGSRSKYNLRGNPQRRMNR